jgi:hypothetical protein
VIVALGHEWRTQIPLDKTRFSSILCLSTNQQFVLNARQHIAIASPAGTLAGARPMSGRASIHIISTTISLVLPLIIIS